MSIEGGRGRKRTYVAGKDEVYALGLVRDSHIQNVEFLRGCPYRIRMFGLFEQTLVA